MTHTYAAKRLLEHGALTPAEMVEITGWARSTVHWVIGQLEKAGVAKRVNAGEAMRVCLQ